MNREAKKIIETLLNQMLMYKNTGHKSVITEINNTYQQIDTMLYGMRTTADVISKAVGFMFDILKVLSKDINEDQDPIVLKEFLATCPPLRNTFKLTAKYHKISIDLLKSVEGREENIKKKLPALIMEMKVHDIHYILDQWMYLP